MQNAAFEDHVAPSGKPKNRHIAGGLLTAAGVLVLGWFPLLPHLHPQWQSVAAAFARTAAPVLLLLGLFGVPILRAFRRCSGGRWEDVVSGGLLWGAGYLLRLAYILRFSYYQMQHDVGRFDDPDGHAGYIRFLFREGCLPQFDVRQTWQFYHPPLHHALAALWMRLWSEVGLRGEQLYETVQLVPFCYACLAVLVFALILRELGLSGWAFRLPLAFFAVHPTFIILSGSLNNDMLSILLMLTALLLTLKWDQKPQLGCILLLALAIGLGMSTKLSAWMAAPAAAYVFLRAFVKAKKKWPMFGQFCVFGAVCIPLGLWWSVRNYIRWGVPISYIPKLSEDSVQYVGEHPISERLFDFSASQFTYIYDCFTMYGQSYNEYNPLIGLLKTAVFDEFLNTNRFPAIAGVGEWLFWSQVVLALLCLIAAVWVTVGRRGKLSQKIVLLLTYLVPLISYYSFCLIYAHTCTQSIRYATPVIYGSLAFAGLFLHTNGGKAAGILRVLLTGAAVLFMGCSVYVYDVLILS